MVSGQERRPSEVQGVSRGWRLPGAMHSSADPTWIRKWLEIQAPELSEVESVELELGSCCSDLDKQVSDEMCRTRKRQFEIPFRLEAASCPRVTSCSIPPGRRSSKRRRTDRKEFTTFLNTPNPNTYVKFIFLRTSPLMYAFAQTHTHTKTIYVHTCSLSFFLSLSLSLSITHKKKKLVHDMYNPTKPMRHRSGPTCGNAVLSTSCGMRPGSEWSSAGKHSSAFSCPGYCAIRNDKMQSCNDHSTS